MNKTAIKNFAVWARRELISRVTQKALQYGITEKDPVPGSAESVNGSVLTEAEKKQRTLLLARIHRSGYSQTLEEIAYTWFNRFCALRFMEVNGYLPTLVRVFTDEEGAFHPQILADAIHLELDGLDRDKVFALKDANRTEELYKYLLITQCNALSSILPGMFQKIEDETELLFPDNLLREESVIAHMVREIPEEDWQDAVQIIGWLYQYYNSEPKDQVFANLKKNIKISKENIPAATQLFTPDWIVRYMVENSLGRIFINAQVGRWTGSEADRQAQEKTIADKLEWKYYLPEAEQTPEVRAELNKLSTNHYSLTTLKVIDPCMGSGHILAYMFDVLMQIYRESGYDDRDAVASIVTNNLFGLDIDDRAAQLAYFSVMMKARQYDRGFFRRKLQPKVYAICESNNVSADYVDYFCKGNDKLAEETHRMIAELHDAKEYGSILNVTPADFSAMYARLEEMDKETDLDAIGAAMYLRPLIQCAEAMAQKYDAVVTNPPYMGSSGMNSRIDFFVKKNYPTTCSDLSTVIMEKSKSFAKKTGIISMINIPVWMYLSSFEKFRLDLLSNSTIINLLYNGRGIFGSDFGTVVFVMFNLNIAMFTGLYKKLFEKKVEVESVETKEQKFFSSKKIYKNQQENYSKIAGHPYAYDMTTKMGKSFENGIILEKIAAPRQGMATGDNDKFLRLWHEIQKKDFFFNAESVNGFLESGFKFAPYNKGGSFRKWYGNQEYVIRFDRPNYSILGTVGNHLPSRQLYFHESISWSKVTMGGFSVRYMPVGFVFDVSGCSLFASQEYIYQILAFLNSKVIEKYLAFFSPTVNYEVGNIKALPYLSYDYSTVRKLALENIKCAKFDWDSFETSWDFVRHPLAVSAYERKAELDAGLCHERRAELVSKLSVRFEQWNNECDYRFNLLKSNEEELNRIFIDIYGLQDELTPDVEEKDVTVRKAELGRDIRSLLSYAVGCMFGRYSLDVDGLAYAGGEWDDSKYTTFPADADNIIPICDDDYFEDDLTGRFVKFIETIYGAETLEENLNFIAHALGGRGSAREVIRNYFRNDFFEDHCKVYQKRPIYWLFDSGKKGGFRALIYMHRYQPDTIAKLRVDYVHEQQERYRTAIAELAPRVDNASGSEKVKLAKRLTSLRDQAEEVRLYEEKIHHLADRMVSIDLDDGVKHNYAIFQDVLARIK